MNEKKPDEKKDEQKEQPAPPALGVSTSEEIKTADKTGA